MKITIQWMEDSTDCETCGSSYASGAVVLFDDEEVIDLSPAAHCYDGSSYEPCDVYRAILEKLGHVVEEEHVPPYEYPSYDDDGDVSESDDEPAA